MQKYPRLKNAPITEALIDIRIKLPSIFDAEKIDLIYKTIKAQYPERQVQKISEAIFAPKEDSVVKSAGAKINGYRYISTDKKQILQTRLDGFTFSRLHPYIKWQNLRDEAFRLWELYKNITSPVSITRVAVRYINNLNIPMPIKDFGDYLTAPPTVPDKLPQRVSSFLTRIVFHEPSINANAIITQALEQIVTDTAPIILDIDVFKFQPKGITEKDVWETIEKLRHFKNKIFFESITNSLKEIYA
ncbi:hypothetical protein ES703_41692 [subsurface metagenome]